MAAPYFHSRSEYDAFGIDIIKKNGIIYRIPDVSKQLIENQKCNLVDSNKVNQKCEISKNTYCKDENDMN